MVDTSESECMSMVASKFGRDCPVIVAIRLPRERYCECEIGQRK